MSTSNDHSGFRPVAPMRGPSAWANRCIKVAYAALLFLYACVAINLPIIAIPEAGVDDGLYVRGAINILKGDWLGAYDNLTLSKGPFYSVWIAFNSFTGLPILLSQALLYGLGCLALARAVRVWLRSELATLCFFAFLLLSPVPVAEGQLRVMREGIYSPMTMFIVAGCIWWVRLKWQTLSKRALLALGVGLLLGCYWATREESVIIVTTLAATLLLLLYLAYLDKDPVRSFSREIALAGLTCLVAVVVYTGFGSINTRYYGVSDVVEFKQSEFVSAYGALSRVRPRQSLRYVIVPHEVLDRAYAVSPAAAELQSYFKQPGYVDAGCAAYEIAPCDGEVHGAWFMWALRDAVASTGHYKTAGEARQFYATLGNQINEACDAGRLECGARRDSMVPRFSAADVVKALRRAGQMVHFMATLQAIEPGNWGKPHSCYVDDCGGSPLYAAFLEIANTSLYAHATWLPLTTTGERNLDVGHTNVQMRSVSVAEGLNALTAAYRIVLPILCGFAALSYLASLVIAGVTRSIEALTVLSTLALITFATRILFMAFLDAVAGMPSFNTLYLSPVFPFLLMFCFLSSASALAHLKRYRRTLTGPKMPHASKEITQQ